MFQLFGDEDDAELSATGPSEAEMIKQRTAAAEDVVILEVEEGVPELQRLTLRPTRWTSSRWRVPQRGGVPGRVWRVPGVHGCYRLRKAPSPATIGPRSCM